MAKERFRIALVQRRCSGDADKNLAAAETGIREAARRGARVVCLPELFRTLYFCQKEDHAAFDLAEPVPGPTTERLGGLARRLGIAVIGSVFERRAAGVYHNTAVVIDADGSPAGTYRKMHIPDDPLYYEKFYFTPGDLGFKVFKTRFGRVGVLVCWDQWYPEAARIAALQGALVIFFPTAIGWHPREKRRHGRAQLEAWRTVQRAHAIANGVYVAAVNRTGHEGPAGGGLDFWGSSFVCGPFGEIIAQAPAGRPTVITADCDPAAIETVRRHWPFLRDRRVDAYGPILNRHIEDQ